ncbi:MAG: spore germination protein [Ruminiclostridium sp.]|nr:spore germination protein [Ruminiclostridium sp.]
MERFGPKKTEIPPHPRQEPRFSGDLTEEGIRFVFRDTVDFDQRPILIGGDPEKKATVFAIMGQVRFERLNDYVLRPLAMDLRFREATPEGAFRMMTEGGIYAGVKVLTTLDQAVFELVVGNVVLSFPAAGKMISCFTITEEKRSVSKPENEPSIKGAMDSFVESLRTNTSLVRRRLRAPELKVKEIIAGRQSVTPIDILYIEGLTDPDLVEQVRKRVEGIDTDELFQAAGFEEQILEDVKTAFPMVPYTQRPDRFCAGLVEGRVGVLVEGIPLGYLLPGDVGQFFKTSQDRTQNWVTTSALAVLRYLCMLLSLFLPGIYVAAVNFHPEMLPARLAWSIAEAKVDVPFSTVFEVLILLAAFEIVQEAGLRLPGPIGTTVSILGGLVVGSAAVEAKIVSPVVLIVVAVAGIAGYTVPSQEFSAALRLWRFSLAIAASLGGLYAVVGLGAVLVGRLAQLESFGTPYLTPFAAAGQERQMGHGVIRWPVTWVKLREAALHTLNRRRQG